jgi:hypothetical protein
MIADELDTAVGTGAGKELPGALGRIQHCLGQLSDEQVWRRSPPSLHSTGNLILHLCGNVRQWIIAGPGGAADIRHRRGIFWPAQLSVPSAPPLPRQLGRLR